jgi:hypothetical protein
MDYCYHKLQCQKCGRKILVEMALIGVPHHTGVAATCAKCIQLPLDEEFRQKHPDKAKDIEEWIKG